jgi:hypothetical protein
VTRRLRKEIPDALVFAEQRIKDIAALDKKFGVKKINLIHVDGSSEGIWCVPVTAADNQKILDDNSHGDKVRVYLVNPPLGWGGHCWGAEVVGTTQGASRPIADPKAEQQMVLDDDSRRLWNGLKQVSVDKSSETDIKYS